jgi:hypothetical protein
MGVDVNDQAIREKVRGLLENTPGVDEVRLATETWEPDLATERAGDFIAISKPDAWFTYYFWENDTAAPDYARSIDIHRKPGYDPCELFIDPALAFPKLRIAKFLLKKKLGLRTLLDVIPLDATLVKGSHGRDDMVENEQPVLLGSSHPVTTAEDVHQSILSCFANR